MDQGVWVELAFTGDVPMQTAEEFVERVDDFAARFGLRLGVGAAHAASERPWPGTAVMLDLALQELAAARGTDVATVRARLEERGQVPTA